MSKSDIVLKEVNKGDLLEEVVRSYLHSANPSAMLTRIINGMRTFATETNSKEQTFVREIVEDIDKLQNQVSLKEYKL